jgi:hypothetical protein
MIPDYRKDATIVYRFTTRDAEGEPTTLSGSPTIAVYKEGSTSEVTTGLTLTADYDGVTGLNQIAIVTTDAFYEADKDYAIVLTAGTVDSVAVSGEVVHQFSLEKQTIADVSGLSTLDAADIRAAVGLNAANLDTQLSDIDDAAVGAESAASAAAADAALIEDRLTAARAGYIDKLNVSGTLAHSDAADTYKADVSGLSTFDASTDKVAVESIDTNAIDAPSISSAAVNKIQAGLSTLTAAGVWAHNTRTLSSFGTLVSDTVAAVWANATRTLSSFGFTVATNNDSNITSIKAKTDSLDFTGQSGMLKSESTNMRGTDNALLAASSDLVAIKSVTDTLDTMIEDSKYTVAALENAPSGGGGGGLTAEQIRAAIGLATANLDTQLSSIKTDTGNIVTGADAIVQKTNNLTFTGTNVNATLPLLQSSSTTLSVTALSNAYIALGMSQADLDSQLAAILSATGSVVGAHTVTVDAGLQNATVIFRANNNIVAVGMTDTGGTVTVGLDAGVFDMIITASGYHNYYEQVTVSEEATLTVTLSQVVVPSSDTDLVTIYGYTRKNGIPDEDVTIWITPVSTDLQIAFNKTPIQTTSDANGMFSFVNMLPSTTYSIQAGSTPVQFKTTEVDIQRVPRYFTYVKN